MQQRLNRRCSLKHICEILMKLERFLSKFHQIRALGLKILQLPPFEGQVKKSNYDPLAWMTVMLAVPHSPTPPDYNTMINRSERKSVSLEGPDLEFCNLMSEND